MCLLARGAERVKAAASAGIQLRPIFKLRLSSTTAIAIWFVANRKRQFNDEYKMAIVCWQSVLRHTQPRFQVHKDSEYHILRTLAPKSCLKIYSFVLPSEMSNVPARHSTRPNACQPRVRILSACSKQQVSCRFSCDFCSILLLALY